MSNHRRVPWGGAIFCGGYSLLMDRPACATSCKSHEAERKRNMIRQIQPEDTFTPEARSRWKKIPEWARKKILDNVLCGRCLSSVTILLETAEMIGKDLILRGKCKQCGKEVCRVVEPENE
jgi:hypothetical protein